MAKECKLQACKSAQSCSYNPRVTADPTCSWILYCHKGCTHRTTNAQSLLQSSCWPTTLLYTQLQERDKKIYIIFLVTRLAKHWKSSHLAHFRKLIVTLLISSTRTWHTAIAGFPTCNTWVKTIYSPLRNHSQPWKLKDLKTFCMF